MPLIAALPRSWRVVLQNARMLARDYGQAATVQSGVATDAAGAAIPWYTYPAIEYLSSFDFGGRRVFEYGSGQSSLFWAARAASVMSVEDDPSWFERLRTHLRANQQLFLKTDLDEYVGFIGTFSTTFDIVVIDGRARRRCAEIAPRFLTENGILIFDNTDWYPRTAAGLRAQGLFQIDFSGFGPVNNYTWTTSVFLRAGTSLQRGYRGPQPIAGLRDDGDFAD